MPVPLNFSSKTLIHAGNSAGVLPMHTVYLKFLGSKAFIISGLAAVL
jgi:hypothetical protein